MAKLKHLLKNIPLADATRFVSDLKELTTIIAKTAVEIAQIEAARNRAIAEIEQRYALYHSVFAEIFDQRRVGIEACFAVIQDGLKTQQREQVLAGLGKLGEVVCSSPFVDFERLARALEGEGDAIEI